MLTDTTTARTPAAAGNLPRPGGGDAAQEAPRLARPRRLRRVGAAAARLALVAGLAVALLVGALALGPRGEAAAATSCLTVYSEWDFYESRALILESYGFHGMAVLYRQLASEAVDEALVNGCS